MKNYENVYTFEARMSLVTAKLNYLGFLLILKKNVFIFECVKSFCSLRAPRGPGFEHFRRRCFFQLQWEYELQCNRPAELENKFSLCCFKKKNLI